MKSVRINCNSQTWPATPSARVKGVTILLVKEISVQQHAAGTVIRFATNSSRYRSIPHVDRNITVASRDTGVVLRRHAILDAQNLQVCISPYCPQHFHHILWFVFVRVSPRKIERATCRKQQETGRMPVSASRSIIFPCIHLIT